MNTYFGWNFANNWMYLPSLMKPKVNPSITYEGGVEFQMETKIICCRGFFSQTTQILMILRCYFAEDCEEMYTVLKRTL